MTAKAGLKAGLIGAAILAVWSVLNQVVLPISGALTYLACGVSILVYATIGALAAFFLVPPRAVSRGAGAGAIAGVTSALVSQVVGIGIIAIRLSMGLGMPGVDPQQMEQLTRSGIDPMVFMIPGVICGLVIGVVVTAIGGAIYAAVKPD